MTKRESKGTQCAKWEVIHCDRNCVTCHALYLRRLVICYYTIIHADQPFSYVNLPCVFVMF